MSALRDTNQSGALAILVQSYDLDRVLDTEHKKHTALKSNNAPSYVKKFQLGKQVTRLVVISKNCNVTYERIKETTPTCVFCESITDILKNDKLQPRFFLMFICCEKYELVSTLKYTSKVKSKLVLITNENTSEKAVKSRAVK